MNTMRCFQVGIGLAAIGAAFAIAKSLPHSRPVPANPPITPAASQPAVASGLKVYIDPATGRMARPPAKAGHDLAADAAFSSSHDGLVEEPGTTAAGGFKVDTQGRFHSAVMVRVGTDGKPVMSCGQNGTAVPARQ